jgi:hypothetical protein
MSDIDIPIFATSYYQDGAEAISHTGGVGILGAARRNCLPVGPQFCRRLPSNDRAIARGRLVTAASAGGIQR